VYFVIGANGETVHCATGCSAAYCVKASRSSA
jgi:hypothetical protein